jgi:hypothetical protein
VAKADAFKRRRDATLALGAANAPHLEREGDVAGNAQMRPERIILKHHAQTAAFGRQEDLGASNGYPRNVNLTGGGRQEPRNEAQQCGLATARWAEQRQRPAL